MRPAKPHKTQGGSAWGREHRGRGEREWRSARADFGRRRRGGRWRAAADPPLARALRLAPPDGGAGNGSELGKYAAAWPTLGVVCHESPAVARVSRNSKERETRAVAKTDIGRTALGSEGARKPESPRVAGAAAFEDLPPQPNDGHGLCGVRGDRGGGDRGGGRTGRRADGLANARPRGPRLGRGVPSFPGRMVWLSPRTLGRASTGER